MSVLEYVLDGLAAELELERELGVRSIECDRALLTSSAKTSAIRGPAPQPIVGGEKKSSTSVFDFVFLHDRRLSPGGVEMMAKAITALGKTDETAPIIIVPPLPKAKLYVVLGGLALRKFFPELRGEPGDWLKSTRGENVLVTYSPEYILRFSEVTPAVRKIKEEMWRNLKSILKRTNS